ncbi:MAG: PA0069 family radical SAM protein [Gemmatimonadota bacterium]|nr:MAG: PA0069 family radical SAM protein [Gemmatimonadota bacterium]
MRSTNGSAPVRGRGASHNPTNRFAALAVVRDGWRDCEDPAPRTELLADGARSIVSHNDSPDVGFDTSVNPYRGCEHGCIYCYARPYHEYLGFSAGLDFETKILVKQDAPSLLRATLDSPRWQPQTILLSGVTDPYQPAERRICLTRSCLEVLAEYRNPVAITTKNYLITRDADLLGQLAARSAAAVSFSITTLDEELARRSEPRASSPSRRLGAIRRLTEKGIPVGVNVAPVIPGLTEHELPRILAAAASAGASYAAYILLRLPHVVSRLFETWLEQYYPDRQDRVLNRIRETRGGKMYDSRFEVRHSGEGEYARHIADIFRIGCRKAGLSARYPKLSTAAFRRRPRATQLRLFD